MIFSFMSEFCFPILLETQKPFLVAYQTKCVVTIFVGSHVEQTLSFIIDFLQKIRDTSI
jgi:hypothetical protein